MDGYSGQAMPANAVKPPELVAGLERMRRLANSLADLGDQLNQQANRLFGPQPATPSSTPASVPPNKDPEPLPPLLYQINDAFETIERNLARASAGANRLAELG